MPVVLCICKQLFYQNLAPFTDIRSGIYRWYNLVKCLRGVGNLLIFLVNFLIVGKARGKKAENGNVLRTNSFWKFRFNLYACSDIGCTIVYIEI